MFVMLCRDSYQKCDKDFLINELEQLTNENFTLKLQLQASRDHLTIYQEFVNKYEQSLLDIGVPESEFIKLDVPF